MQIALHTYSTVEAYLTGQQWRQASLACCPLHPSGGCGLVRHGSYSRTRPAGMRIARWYCPQGHRTFSLLPDFLAARLPGLLADVEMAVFAALKGSSLESVAAKLRAPELTLPSAVRWLRRRVSPVRAAIDALLAGGMCGMSGVFVAKGFLEQLRRDLDTNTLAKLPAPLGWRRRRSASDSVAGEYQHEMGADRPSVQLYRGWTTSELPAWPPRRSLPHRPPPPSGRSWRSGAPTDVLASKARSSTCSGSGGCAATAPSAAWTSGPNSPEMAHGAS